MAVPGSPPTLTVATRDAGLDLTWGASTNTPTNYQIYYATSASGPWTLFEVNPAADRTSLITPLTNGTQYWVQVTASNADGVSAPATSGPHTPNPTPAVPSNVAAYAVGGDLFLSWFADPVATRYVVRWRPTGTSTFGPINFVDAPATSFRITGLTVNTDYDISVAANNATGTSVANIIGPISPVPGFTAGLTGVSAVSVDADTVRINWFQNVGDGTGFDFVVLTSPPPGVPVVLPPGSSDVDRPFGP